MQFRIMTYDKVSGTRNTVTIEASSMRDAREEVETNTVQVLTVYPIGVRTASEPALGRASLDRTNLRRAYRGQEPIYDNPGFRPCHCEDYPCCGH